MDDGEYSVDILDKSGKLAGKKLRKEIVKGQDIYHAVYCVLITPEEKIAVSKIASRKDLPNMHAGSYGCTAATIKRSGESGDEAMARALKNELNLTASPVLINDEMLAVDGTYRKIGLYTVRAEVPTQFSKQDIQEISVFTAHEFAQLIAEQPAKVTPLLHLFWEKYQT